MLKRPSQNSVILVSIAAVYAILIGIAVGIIPKMASVCNYDYQGTPENCTQHSIFIAAFPNTVHILDLHNGLITALATAVIGIFTIFLARTSAEQGRLTKSSIELARNEFNASFRPKITTRFFRPNMADHGDQISVFFHIVNEGAAKASITEVGTKVFFWLGPWTHGAREIHFNVAPSTAILESGQEERIFTEQEFTRSEMLRTVQNSNDFWWCIGYIDYKDANNIRRRTGFCRKWNFATQNWDREPNDDWEYSY